MGDATMTEYTPTTEQVRTAYSIDPEAEWRDPLTNHTKIHEREFDRWIRAHDAEVAANALREAVHLFEASPVLYTANYSARSRLADEADRIEREATNPELGSSEGSERG